MVLYGIIQTFSTRSLSPFVPFDKFLQEPFVLLILVLFVYLHLLRNLLVLLFNLLLDWLVHQFSQWLFPITDRPHLQSSHHCLHLHEPSVRESSA